MSETIRPTATELDKAYRNAAQPVSAEMYARLVPTDPCRTCGCPVYIPGGRWQMGQLSPVSFWTCGHGPENELWRVKWSDLTVEQQADLARVSAVAAIRVKGWSK